MAVYHHNGLLKASIMSATNAHRLGGNEAPPAIISSFLGTQLTELLDHIEESDASELLTLKGKKGMAIDIPQIPTSSSTIPTATARRPLPLRVTASSSAPQVPVSTAPQP